MVEFSVSPGNHGRAPRAPAVRRVVIDLAIMTAVGLFLAIIGPFGSIEMPLAWRLVTWLGFAYAGYAIYRPMGLLVDRAEAALELPRPALWFAATLIATVPMAALVWIAGHLPPPIPLPGLETGLLHYFYVFVIGGAVVALFHVIRVRRSVPDDPGAAPGRRLDTTMADQDPAHAIVPPTASANPFYCPSAAGASRASTSTSWGSTRRPSGTSSRRWRWRTTTSASTLRWDPISCSCGCETRSPASPMPTGGKSIAAGGWRAARSRMSDAKGATSASS